MNLDHLGSFFPNIIFYLNFGNLVPTTFLGRRKMISINRWWKRENKLNDNSTFERMEITRGSFENLKS